MRNRVQAGFTLLELLVAVALMAVLAVLSWRGLDSVLRSRDQITAHTDETRAVVVLFSQLDEDLRRSWSVRLMGLSRQPVAFLRDTIDGPVRLDVLREAAGDSPVQIEHVVYRLRGREIERGFEPWQPSDEARPVGAMVWQPVLGDVDAIEWRGWLEGRKAWQTGEALASLPSGASAPSGAAGATAAAVPPATGVTLTLQYHGERLTRVFALRD